MRSLGLAAMLAFGIALVGYGVLPYEATDMSNQDRFVGGVMICAGLACVSYVAANLRPKIQ